MGLEPVLLFHLSHWTIHKNGRTVRKTSGPPCLIVFLFLDPGFIFSLYFCFNLVMKSTFFLTYFAFLGACGSAFANHQAHRRHHARSSAAIATAAKENKPTSGTPVSEFAANANLPAAGLAAAAKKAKKAGQKYQISQGSKSHSTIYTDWADFNKVCF
jgi:hypothetical protein